MTSEKLPGIVGVEPQAWLVLRKIDVGLSGLAYSPHRSSISCPVFWTDDRFYAMLERRASDESTSMQDRRNFSDLVAIK